MSAIIKAGLTYVFQRYHLESRGWLKHGNFQYLKCATTTSASDEDDLTYKARQHPSIFRASWCGKMIELQQIHFLDGVNGSI